MRIFCWSRPSEILASAISIVFIICFQEFSAHFSWYWIVLYQSRNIYKRCKPFPPAFALFFFWLAWSFFFQLLWNGCIRKCRHQSMIALFEDGNDWKLCSFYNTIPIVSPWSLNENINDKWFITQSHLRTSQIKRTSLYWCYYYYYYYYYYYDNVITSKHFLLLNHRCYFAFDIFDSSFALMLIETYNIYDTRQYQHFPFFNKYQ